MNTSQKFHTYSEDIKEAERAFLGSLFVDIKEIDTLDRGFDATVFLDPRNGLIYQAMEALHATKVTPDYLTVTDWLKKNGRLEEAGGVSYITGLSDMSFTSGNIKSYEGIVLQGYLRRSFMKILEEERLRGLELSNKTEDLLDEGCSRMLELSLRGNAEKASTFQEILEDSLRDLAARIKMNKDVSGIESGIRDLDDMTQGFMDSEFTVIGARPSMGKTSLVLTFICHECLEQKVPTLFFSLEMSERQIAERLLSMMSGIKLNKFRSGKMTMQEYGRLRDFSADYYKSPLTIVGVPNMKLLDLKMEARRCVREKGIKIIFIDYMGLIESPHPDAPVYEQQSEVSRSLKALSRELEIPVVALCQVTRSAEGKEPSLAELRGSGSIEQDADCVVFIHGERNLESDAGLMLHRKLIIAKQRNGPVGTVGIDFFPSLARFKAVEKN